MPEYAFTLKFRLPATAADPGSHVPALAEAGCDDATVGIGQAGRIALDFVREAGSAQQAIVSATRAVKRAITGAELLEASPDFVGLTDVADLVGCTRQNIRKLMLSNAATFPAAVHEGTQAIWHLRPVLAWFADIQQRPVDQALVDVAEVAMKVNLARQTRRLRGARVPRAIAALFA